MCLTRIQVFAHEVRCAQAGGISSDSEARDQDDLCHPSSRRRMLVAEAEEQVDAKEEEAKKEAEGEERGGGGDEAAVNCEASLADRLIERLQDDSVRECLQADSTSTGAEPPVDKADARAVVTLSVPHTRSSESPGGSISAGDVGADDGGEGDDSSVAGSRRDVGGGGDGHGEVIDVQKLEKGARHVSAAARSKRCVSAQCIQRVAAVAGVRVSMPYVDWAWTDEDIWWERRHKALPWTVCLRLAVHPSLAHTRPVCLSLAPLPYPRVLFLGVWCYRAGHLQAGHLQAQYMETPFPWRPIVVRHLRTEVRRVDSTATRTLPHDAWRRESFTRRTRCVQQVRGRW